jgi:hypothetical protein
MLNAEYVSALFLEAQANLHHNSVLFDKEQEAYHVQLLKDAYSALDEAYDVADDQNSETISHV